jgi:hypothetical protein
MQEDVWQQKLLVFIQNILYSPLNSRLHTIRVYEKTSNSAPQAKLVLKTDQMYTGTVSQNHRAWDQKYSLGCGNIPSLISLKIDYSLSILKCIYLVTWNSIFAVWSCYTFRALKDAHTLNVVTFNLYACLTNHYSQTIICCGWAVYAVYSTGKRTSDKCFLVCP